MELIVLGPDFALADAKRPRYTTPTDGYLPIDVVAGMGQEIPGVPSRSSECVEAC